MKFIFGLSGITSAFAWTYRDFTEWPTEAPLCAATQANQSPIDITATSDATTPLKFQGFPDPATHPQLVHELVVNDHTWEMEWDTQRVATDVFAVEYNGKLYALKQFHFHSPSEHTLNGQHYDLEAHMVHACYGNITCDTQDPNDENLVVAIWMNVGDENHFLSTFFPQLATLADNATAPKELEEVANPYEHLVPAAPHDFYQYTGSTTTPACVQNVLWFLMSNPVTLSQAQLTSYRTAISSHANTQTVVSATAPTGVSAGWDVTLGTNNRPVQDIGTRVVQKYETPDDEDDNTWWYVLAAVLGALAVGLVGLALYLANNKAPKKSSTRAVKTPAKKAPPPPPP
jgi:carbonic anhydrase